MVGEIRNAETAEMACRTALIGRTGLCTLHTDSADAAVKRLVDLGVDRFIVDDVLRGALAQELRVIPSECCAGTSCARCGGSGSGGRQLVAELIDYTEPTGG
ncbi:MAG: ATPase, T2SS/T4P/T4SS family [Pseudomonadota bacterium]